MTSKTFLPMIGLTAILVACGDVLPSSQSSSSSSTNSVTTEVSSTSSLISSIASSSGSSITNRLKVSEMMAEMTEGNYTLTLTSLREVLYEFAVDLPLVYGIFPSEDDDTTFSFYLDLTNANSPVLYSENETGQWFSAPVDALQIEDVLAPLYFIDPTNINDAWFTWDEATGAYILAEDHYQDFFTSTDGIEDFTQVTVLADTPTGNLIITIEGIDPEMPGVTQSIQFTYSEIGTTTVTLPTDILDYVGYFLDDLLPTSTNHTYQWQILEGTMGTNQGNSVSSILGERDDFTYSLLDFKTFNQTYITPNNEGSYDQIDVKDGSGTQQTIQAQAYQAFIADFYPLDVLNMERTWLDLQQPTIEPTFGVTMYPIRAEAMDDLLIDDYFDNANNITGQVTFLETDFTGPMVQVTLNYVKNSLPYTSIFQMFYFDVTTIFPPIVSGPSDVLGLLNAVRTTNNYGFSQSQFINDTSYFGFSGQRDGDTFLIFDAEDDEAMPIYYTMDAGNYLMWSFDEETLNYVAKPIDKAAYEAATIQQFYLDFSAFSNDDLLPNFEIPGGYELQPEVFDKVIQPALLSQFAISKVSFQGFSGNGFDTSLNIFIEATDLVSQAPAFISLSLYGIDHIVVEIPGETEENPLLTLDEFQSIFANGIQSTLGTLGRYLLNGVLVEEWYFGYHPQAVAKVDPSILTNQQITLITNQGAQGYAFYNGILGSPLTVPVNSTEAAFMSLKSTFPTVDFAALTLADLTFIDLEPFVGGYFVNPAFITNHTENILLPGDIVVQASLFLTETTVYLTIDVTNQGETFVIRLELDALNEDFDLFTLLNAVN